MPATQTTMDVDLQKLLTAIYTQNYLIGQLHINESGNSNFLVYSAELKCTQGSKSTYLKLEERIDTFTNEKYVGHGSTINGLPQANQLDVKPDVNIDSFGECALLQYEDAQTQHTIRTLALTTNRSVCACIRNLADRWQFFYEDDMMLVGDEVAISKKSVLACSPNIVSAYQGSAAGEIQAVDSGQMNLHHLLENYRFEYQTLLQNSIKPPASSAKVDVLTAFTQAKIDEYLYLYELYYPDRVRAFNHFMRNEKKSVYIADIEKIRFMLFMLKEDKYIKKITDVMHKKRSLNLAVNNSTTDPSNFSSSNNCVTMTKIVVQSGYDIPYHVFFHEFGHAIDFYETSGKKFYSDKFQYEQYERIPSLSIDANNNIVYSYTSKKAEKSLQEWAASDAKNLLYRLGADVMNSSADPVITALSASSKIFYIKKVVTQYMLSGDGIYTILTSKNAVIVLLHKEIKNKSVGELQDQQGVINLAKDIYEGTTGGQIGGGHGYSYWYYEAADKEVTKGVKKIGDRKNEINKEAFAGFFEYKVMGIVDGIDPARKTLPKTIAALEGMLKEIMV